MLAKAIPHFGLEGIFQDIRGLDDHYAHSKVDLGRELLASVGGRPAAAVMIGDTMHDFETAQELGISCILVAHGHNARHRLEQAGVPVIDALDQLFAASS